METRIEAAPGLVELAGLFPEVVSLRQLGAEILPRLLWSFRQPRPMRDAVGGQRRIRTAPGGLFIVGESNRDL